jgi:hypothetical protein
MALSLATIDNICADPSVNKDTIKAYKNMLVKLTDLSFYKSDEGEYYPYSKAINTIADEVDVCEARDPNTGDVGVWAWPSASIDNTRVFTNPPYYWLGDSNLNGFGITPNQRIEELMDEDELSFRAKKQIRNWLRSHPAISYL